MNIYVRIKSTMILKQKIIIFDDFISENVVTRIGEKMWNINSGISCDSIFE